jgi:hypothetical protein
LSVTVEDGLSYQFCCHCRLEIPLLSSIICDDDPGFWVNNP